MGQSSIMVTLRGRYNDKTQGVELGGIEVNDLQLVMPLINGKNKNWTCSIEINGNICFEKKSVIFHEWGYSDGTHKKNKIVVGVKIVNGGKVLRNYIIKEAILEQYREGEDEGNINAVYTLVFKFSKINLIRVEEQAKPEVKNQQGKTNGTKKGTGKK